MSRSKIFVITNMIAPYRIPLFNALAERYGHQLAVVFSARLERDRQWDLSGLRFAFVHKVLRGLHFYIRGKAVHMNPSLILYLLREKPNVVIVSGYSFQTILVMFYAKFMNRPFIIWSEATSHSEVSRGKIRYVLRKLLIKKASAVVAASSCAKAYFKLLGAAANRIFLAIQTIDVKAFSRECAIYEKRKRSIRKTLGLSNKIVLLYSGQLIQRKGVIYLLRAFAKVKKEYANTMLLIVGHGPEYENLRVYCKERGILDSVLFAGFKQVADLAKYYAISDFFVFPTLSDTFGVVINEALAAGLPIVCSKYAGAASDLVIDGGNGYIINPFDTEDFAEKCLTLVRDYRRRARMATRSRKMLYRCTIDKAARGFFEAIEYAISKG